MSLHRTTGSMEDLVIGARPRHDRTRNTIVDPLRHRFVAGLTFLVIFAGFIAWALQGHSSARLWRLLMAAPVALGIAAGVSFLARRRDEHLHSEADVEAAIGAARIIALPLPRDVSTAVFSDYEQTLATLLEREHGRGASTLAFTSPSESTNLSALVSASHLRLVAQGIHAQVLTVADALEPRNGEPEAREQLTGFPKLRLIPAPAVRSEREADTLAVLADAVFVVLTSGATRRAELDACWKRLQAAGVKHLWLVLCDVPRAAASVEMGAEMDNRGNDRPHPLRPIEGEPEPAVLQKQVYDMMQKRADRQADVSSLAEEQESITLNTVDGSSHGPQDRKYNPSTGALEESAEEAELSATPPSDGNSIWMASQESIMHLEPAELRHDLARAEFTDANAADDLPDSAPAVRSSFFKFFDRRATSAVTHVEAVEIERAFERVLKRPDPRNVLDVSKNTNHAALEDGPIVWKRLEQVQSENLFHSLLSPDSTGLHPSALEPATLHAAAVSFDPADPPAARDITPDEAPESLYEIKLNEEAAKRPVITALPSDAAAIALRMAAMPTEFDFSIPLEQPAGEVAGRPPSMIEDRQWLESAEAERIRKVLARFSDQAPQGPEATGDRLWFGEDASLAAPSPASRGIESNPAAEAIDPSLLRFGNSLSHGSGHGSTSQAAPAVLSPWTPPQIQSVSPAAAVPSSEPPSWEHPRMPIAPATTQPATAHPPVELARTFAPAEAPGEPGAAVTSLTSLTSEDHPQAEQEPAYVPVWPAHLAAAAQPRANASAATTPNLAPGENADPRTPKRAWLEPFDQQFWHEPTVDPALPTQASRAASIEAFAASPAPHHQTAEFTAAEPMPLTTAYSEPVETRGPAPQTPFAALMAAEHRRSAGEKTAPVASPLLSHVAEEPVPSQRTSSEYPDVDRQPADPSEDQPTPWKTRKPPVSVLPPLVDLTPQSNRWDLLRHFDPSRAEREGMASSPQPARGFADSSPHTRAAR